jgi:uncharacterized DUF497 family protein
MPRHLHFEWDESKATLNERKHGVAFSLATSIFRDLSIQTLFDENHSESEERWIGLGLASNGELLVVIHLWTETDPANVTVRIISARKATGGEEAGYRESL